MRQKLCLEDQEEATVQRMVAAAVPSQSLVSKDTTEGPPAARDMDIIQEMEYFAQRPNESKEQRGCVDELEREEVVTQLGFLCEGRRKNEAVVGTNQNWTFLARAL